MTAWIIERHSGRDNMAPRFIRCVSETHARKRFLKMKEAALRQGEVRLIDPDGKVIDSCWAPRLRTRW